MHTGRIFNVVCINPNGLRAQLKRDLLGKLLQDLQAGVGLITETHLRKPELKWIRYPTYNMVADYCRRVPMGQQIAGGVIILAHWDFTTKKLPRNLHLSPTIEQCSTKIYSTKGPITAICLTAVYIPPKKAKVMKIDMLRKLGSPK